MPDFGAPIAQNVDVNPNKGLQTLSDLMGLQQRQIGIQQARQTLQTGSYLQQQAQAEAAQATQKNSELQALAKFTHDASGDPNYLNPDGTPNVAKYQKDASSVAPVYGQQFIGQMTSNFNQGVENRKALFSLNADQRQKAASFFSSVATNPNATTEDLLTAAQQARGLSDDPGYQRTIDRMLVHAPPTATLPTANASATIRQYAQTVMNAASGQLPSTPGQIDTGPSIQPGSVNRFTGEFIPAGAPISKDIPPSVMTSPAGPFVRVGPGGRTMTPLTTTGAGGGGPPTAAAPANLNITRAAQENVQGMAADDRGRYAQISQEGTNARTGAQLADQIADLSDQVRTGQLTKEWADRLTALRQHDPDITARQMLTKYAAQLKTMATVGATTDASRSQIDEGMPSPETMDPDAVKQAAQYVGGIFRQRQARQTYADQFVRNNGGNSMGIRDVDDAFMRSSDPTVFAYEALPAGKARQDFLRQHGLTTPERQAAFQAQRNQIKHYGTQ
jgi:hypothetical protein